MRTTKEAKKWVKLAIAATIAGISLSGCGTITNAHVRHMNNNELILAHYQVINRLNGPHYFSGRAFDDGDISSDTGKSKPSRMNFIAGVCLIRWPRRKLLCRLSRSTLATRTQCRTKQRGTDASDPFYLGANMNLKKLWCLFIALALNVAFVHGQASQPSHPPKPVSSDLPTMGDASKMQFEHAWTPHLNTVRKQDSR